MNSPQLPTVSVIIPVYNAMPYLEQTLASIAQQSIGTDALEIVVVNDGSTDGSGAFLDAWATEKPWQMKVIHQQASGGPSRPRNVGLDHATGKYVFFLDGDDCVGPEALERLVAMAEKNGSDTVLAKLIGVGRRVPKQVFAKNVDKADLSKGDVYYTLMPFKLFRRSMLEAHGLRFPEHMRISEDQHFVARAYLHSKVISIVGDYNCYYVVKRGDDKNITANGIELRTALEQADEMVALVTDLTEPGELRDHLIGRHVNVEMVRRFDRGFLDADSAARKEQVELARPYAQKWITPAILAKMPLHEKLISHCLREGFTDELVSVVEWELAGRPGKSLIRNGRLYAAPPFPAADSPAYEELCDITPAVLSVSPRRWVDRLAWSGTVLELSGYAYLDQVDTDDLTTEVVLRHARSGKEVAVTAEQVPSPHLTVARGKETYDYGRACFRARVDLATADGGNHLPKGDWHLSLRCTAQGLTASGALGTALSGKVSRRADEHALSLPGAAKRLHTARIGPRDGQLLLQLKPAPSVISAYAFSFGWKAARAVRARINWN
ncbi:glycosyltransferase family A protein [Streptomyces sp. ME08-AFT2]|uniref:glycosyltransferase family 2 protein n=1 Tax=Streptomyces sp. ME08-AFT2 TaxID=3028683 RepID=UPI0029B38999|nr:glycosyltransferase family A protein [Streptomyces sp. ME08-AFT2]MDX3315203.1 glycosyltransferase family A protein [Streptomyces sp. ME08-AFT2]